MAKPFKNPFRPGAGHMPPYLAGREPEIKEFQKLLTQDVILENIVLTGLRGVGKTVLLETFKPLAIQAGWLWVGTDLSESTSVTEETLAIRLLADLSIVTGQLVVSEEEIGTMILNQPSQVVQRTLDYAVLEQIFRATPGLIADKLKNVLETAWHFLSKTNKRGVIFAYDEAQNLADHSADKQYPLSLLLDIFQSIQKKEIPFMLALTGLPTLFPKLVDARTFAERMFHVISIDRLHDADCRKAITEPVCKDACPVTFSDLSVENIVRESGGYPYFIQFLCREMYDVVIQQIDAGSEVKFVDLGIVRKLDADFFDGRWSKATDRQRDLLIIISSLQSADAEFTVAEIVDSSQRKTPRGSFSSSHVNQMLAKLCDSGLIYKNRFGKYSFAVPLLAQFIRRRHSRISMPGKGLFD
jgi:type II secretory pathway predicted ATPase ExeA